MHGACRADTDPVTFERLRRAMYAAGVVWLFAPAACCLALAGVIASRGGPSGLVVPLLLVGLAFASVAAARLWW